MATKARITFVLLALAVSNVGCDTRAIRTLEQRGSGIIAILEGLTSPSVPSLLLPAVQMARETART